MDPWGPLVHKDAKLVPDGATLVPQNVNTKLVPDNPSIVPEGVSITSWQKGDVNTKIIPSDSSSNPEKQTYDAIKRGYRSPDDIAISTGRSESEVKTAIQTLVRQGLVKNVAPDVYITVSKSTGAKYIPTGDISGSNI